jgi:hypothetical protein
LDKTIPLRTPESHASEDKAKTTDLAEPGGATTTGRPRKSGWITRSTAIGNEWIVKWMICLMTYDQPKIFYMRSLVVYKASVNIEYRTRNFEPMKEKILIVSLLNSIFLVRYSAVQKYFIDSCTS